LPFGFNISIGEIQNQFNIMRDGAPVAGLSTVGASISLQPANVSRVYSTSLLVHLRLPSKYLEQLIPKGPLTSTLPTRISLVLILNILHLPLLVRDYPFFSALKISSLFKTQISQVLTLLNSASLEILAPLLISVLVKSHSTQSKSMFLHIYWVSRA
jgi:hypothetical protein